MENKNKIFVDLNLAKFSFATNKNDDYLIYSDPVNYVKIKASNAFVAIEKSGIKFPYKILHQYDYISYVLDQNDLVKSETKDNIDINLDTAKLDDNKTTN